MWTGPIYRCESSSNFVVVHRDTADVYTRVAVARPSSQLGRVNPRIVRDAQSQSAVKQQDLTIDKAEDQLRGTTGRRPDCHCSSPALWIWVSNMGVLDVVVSSASPRSLAVSISLSFLILSYLFLGTYIPRSPTLYSGVAHRMHRSGGSHRSLAYFTTSPYLPR